VTSTNLSRIRKDLLWWNLMDLEWFRNSSWALLLLQNHNLMILLTPRNFKRLILATIVVWLILLIMTKIKFISAQRIQWKNLFYLLFQKWRMMKKIWIILLKKSKPKESKISCQQLNYIKSLNRINFNWDKACQTHQELEKNQIYLKKSKLNLKF
jgi:hypothetical protein